MLKLKAVGLYVPVTGNDLEGDQASLLSFLLHSLLFLLLERCDSF